MSIRIASFPSAGVELTGVLTTPAGDGPFPTALLLAGSGPLDRDGNIKRLRLNLSHDLAAFLAGRGWASFRFDKRGVGESGGDYLSTGFYDELADIEEALAWLAAQPEVRTVVLVGHSVGATMAVELAARHPDVAAAVLLAFTAKTGAETLEWQTQQVKDHLLPRPVKALLRLFGSDVVKQQRKAIAKLQATTADVARIQLVKVNAKWMREFIAYDPMPSLRRITVPVLAITGSKDVQVDPADLAVVADVVPGAATRVIGNVDHILREEHSGVSNPRFYRTQVSRPIDPRVTAWLEAWLAEQE